MKWKRISDEAIRCDPWTIARVRVRSVVSYELWHDKMPSVQGRFSKADDAKAEADRIEKAGQA